jgi:hypothetical protein
MSHFSKEDFGLTRVISEPDTRNQTPDDTILASDKSRSNIEEVKAGHQLKGKANKRLK